MASFRWVTNNPVAGAIKSAGKSVGSHAKSFVDDLPSNVGKVYDFAVDKVNDFGNGIANVWDKVLNGQTNETNERIARETNASNERIAQENLKYQRELQEYNKALQEKIFQREDSAYTRTASDMRSAGLNPLSMNGTNGAGEAIALSPLNNGYEEKPWNYQSMSPLDALSTVLGYSSALESIKGQRLSNEAQSLANSYNQQTLSDRVNAQTYETMMKQTESLLRSYDEANAYQKRIYNSMFGIVDGMSESERQSAIINTVIGDDNELKEALELSGNKYTNQKNKRYSKTYSTIQAGKGIGSILKAILQ